MNLMDEVAKVAPEHYDFLTKTAAEIRQSPFKDEIAEEMDGIIKAAEEAAEKIAFGGFGSIAGQAGKAIGNVASGMGGAASKLLARPIPNFVASTIIGGVALNLAGDLYDAARRGLTKSRHWGAMLDNNPDLAEQSKIDPNVKVMFDTLHRFNPEFASDPHTAASFVKAQLEYPTDLSLPAQMVQARKNIRDASYGFEGVRVPSMTPADLEEQGLRMEQSKAQTQNAKAQGFKNRIEGQRAYDERVDQRRAALDRSLERRGKTP